MLLSLVVGIGLVAGAPSAPKCSVDTKAILALDIEAFDQSEKGWRNLAAKPGCDREAAELIETYRGKVEQFVPLLYWHQGQILASIGENESAVALMEKARRSATLQVGDGWNDYVDATIAFLKNDPAGLAAAEKRLGARPRPADWPAGREWPMNFKIVQSLGRCVGKPYSEAYAPDCGLK